MSNVGREAEEDDDGLAVLQWHLEADVGNSVWTERLLCIMYKDFLSVCFERTEKQLQCEHHCVCLHRANSVTLCPTMWTTL